MSELLLLEEDRNVTLMEERSEGVNIDIQNDDSVYEGERTDLMRSDNESSCSG